MGFCLSWVRSIKQQDYPAAIQVIIVDDGSTDATRKVILDNGVPNLKLIASEHGGKSKALNVVSEKPQKPHRCRCVEISRNWVRSVALRFRASARSTMA